MYTVVTRANDTLLYIWKLLGEQTLRVFSSQIGRVCTPSYHKEKNCTYVWCAWPTKLTVVIILQYISMTNHYAAPLKLI